MVSLAKLSDNALASGRQGKAPSITIGLIRVNQSHVCDIEAIPGLERRFARPVAMTMLSLNRQFIVVICLLLGCRRMRASLCLVLPHEPDAALVVASVKVNFGLLALELELLRRISSCCF